MCPLNQGLDKSGNLYIIYYISKSYHTFKVFYRKESAEETSKLCFESFLFPQKLFYSWRLHISCRNEYLNKAYAGAWFRQNFQDLLSYRGAQKLEWFEVLEGNDCGLVPATVNAGRPPRDICIDADAEERRCICINTGREEAKTGYEQICGTCRNPCLFKFTPDEVPKYVQKLAVQDSDEEDKEEEDYYYDDWIKSKWGEFY